jgi:ATP-binding cassette subfamily B protein
VRSEFGYFEEDQLGKPYNIDMLKRLYPYAKPYKALFSVSVILVFFMTLLDLALPYVTKIAIDRFIVPGMSASQKRPPGGKEDKIRFYKADLHDPEIRKVVLKYPEKFFVDNHTAAIPYDQLSLLKPEDLSILRKRDVFGLGVSAIVLLGIAAASFALNFFQVQVMESAGQQMMHDLRMTLFAQIQRQKVPFFTQNPVGRLVTRVTNDVQNMHELFTSVVVVVFKDLFLLFGIAVVLVVINWKLAIISFTVLPFVAFASFKFSNLARDAFRILRVKLAEINTHFAETISGIRVIQAFLHERENCRRFERLNHENYIAGMLQIKIFAVFMPIIELLAACAVGMIVYYGGGAALSGRISLGALVAFLSYM